MEIKPRLVEPGFTRRWPKEALELWLRSFHIWMALAVFWCAACVLLKDSFVLWPLGLFLWGASSELAAKSDEQGTVGVAGLLDSASRSFRYLVGLVKDNWIFLALAIALAAALVYGVLKPAAELAAKTAEAKPPVVVDLSDPLTWMFGIHSPLVYAAAALYMGAMMLTFSMRIPMMGYSVHRATALEGRAVGLLLMQGALKNPLAAAAVELATLLSTMVCMVALPIATPLLACFLPCLAYVASREMFFHGDGNKPVTQNATEHRTSVSVA